MNILEIEDIIKGLPDQSLIQEAQAPSGQMPQFLVVSEIQRRADMRKRFQNQQQEMPQGTIADQIVQSGIASMGNRQPIQSMPPQGMPSQGMPPMPQQGMPQGMPQQGMPMQQQPPMMPPMSPPMMPPAQGMAAGGVVRMQAGTQTPYTGGEILAQREKRRQENYESSPFGGQLFVDNRPRDIRLGSLFFTPATDFSGFDSEVDKFLSPYLNPSFDVSSDAAGGNAQKADTKRFGEGTKTANPETTAEAIETGMNTGSSEKTVQKDLSKDSDYSSLQAAIDQFKPVDYSAFKPDYLNLITEQERRAQKIRDDASKDASAQALIQLGAGLAAGDISKGLSAAGQSVADIKRQARAEARDEEGFARQLRLAQDEAGMQLGIKGAEAEREMARFKATYGVSLKELENTMTLAREQIAAEANTEAGRALRGELDALNNLIKNLMSEQYEGDIEQNKAAIAQAVSRMQFLLGITGEKQNKEKDPLDV
jgi:hypothetical protein